MRDINFFEPYIDKKELKLNKELFFYIFIIFGVIFIVGMGIYNQLQIRYLDKLVTNLQVVAEDPKTMEKVSQIKDKEIQVSNFRNEVEKIQTMDQIIESGDIIDEYLLDEINSKLPSDLFLTSLTLQNRNIHLIGISKDKWSVANLSKGLEDLEEVDDIYISNISSMGDYHNFNLDITLKEVVKDGEGEEATETTDSEAKENQ